MKLKLLKKLFLTTAGVFVITLTLVFVLMSVAVSDTFSKDRYTVLNNSCDIVSESLLSDGVVVSNSTEAVISSLAKVNNIDVFVSDSHGKIVLCGCDSFASNHMCNHTNSIIHSEFLRNISTTNNVQLSSVGGMYEGMNYTAFKKVGKNPQNSFYVFAVSGVMNATDILKLMFGMYAISAIIPILFMFIAEYSIVYRLIRPLKYMSVAAKSIAKGDFTKKIPVMSNDEIGELSVLFNKMTDSLSRSEKTSKSFVANVSHELKTPMTTISGFIDGIIDGTIEDDKKEYYLKIVSEEVKRLSRLVQSMLSLSKLESGDNLVKHSNFKLSDTIVNVVVSMEQTIVEKQIEIVGLDTLSEAVISADYDLLYQVFYNLTDNAVKFTPQKGKIEFSLFKIQDCVEFRIKNFGTGIPSKDIPHIFERFYKIDKSRSNYKDSLGLGLYISKTIVELHGGKISADSVFEEYTEFTVVLPIDFKERS